MHIYDNCTPPPGAQPQFPQEIISSGNFNIFVFVTNLLPCSWHPRPTLGGTTPISSGNNFLGKFQPIHFCYKLITLLASPWPFPRGSHPCFLRK